MTVAMRGCLLSLLAAVALAACDQIDPYTRPGVWHVLGANADNLRAMVANPADLDRGEAAIGSPGDLAATAVARLRSDRTKKLPDSAVTAVQVSGNGAGAESGGGGSGVASGGDATASP